MSPIRGVIWGLIAFFSWGLVPIYWKFLHHVGFNEVLGHRIVWASVFLGIFLFYKNQLSELKTILKIKKNIFILLASTILIFFNWNLFIWAVDKNFIVECSLGYFITPLINIFLGVFLLKEKLKIYQWVSVFLAFLGISFMLAANIGRPEISIGLALSFGLYGLLKKQMKVGSLHGLFFETTVLLLPALIYFSYLIKIDQFGFINFGLKTMLLLIGGGLVTSIPLVAFGFAVQSLPLSTIGIMQYIAPSLQLASGVFLYNEPFTKTHLYSFSFIWLGLLVYSVGGLIIGKKYAARSSVKL